MKLCLLVTASKVSSLCLLTGTLMVAMPPTGASVAAPTRQAQTAAFKSNTSRRSELSQPNGAIQVPSTVASIATSKEQSQTAILKSNTSRRFIAQVGSQLDDSSAAQVTSVSQLSDVQPTDWAFQALQSLVERYGCIAGYPNGTFQGNRALTRYELAAGLNACLNRVNELIAAGTSSLVGREDLATLQRLRQDFATELTTLRGRVDNLEAQTAQLEANQFSVTSKLNGEVIIAAIGATGGARNTKDPNTILVDRVRLNLNTSFTGKDLLITGLQAYNLGGGTSSIGGALGLQDGLGLSSSNVRVAFEPQFPGTDIKTLGAVGGGNSVQLYKLLYVFPVAKSVVLFAGPAVETTDAGVGVNPFYSEGQEAISRFAGVNPVGRVSGGTSETGVASAGGFIWNISKNFGLKALYASVNANLPRDLGFPGTPLGAGLFGGSTVAEAQLDIKPTKNVDLALNYANSHHQVNLLATGLGGADIGTLYGLPATQQVHINSVGGTASLRLSSKVTFTGYGAAFFVDNDGGSRGSTTVTTWMAGLRFNDLLAKGNSAGILFGQPLYRVSASGNASLPPNRSTPYHVEAYYHFRVNDNISITPGAFVLFNPEGNSKNNTTAVAVLRTTFSF